MHINVSTRETNYISEIYFYPIAFYTVLPDASAGTIISFSFLIGTSLISYGTLIDFVIISYHGMIFVQCILTFPPAKQSTCLKYLSIRHTPVTNTSAGTIISVSFCPIYNKVSTCETNYIGKIYFDPTDS